MSEVKLLSLKAESLLNRIQDKPKKTDFSLPEYAFYNNSLPVNPLPFLERIYTLVKGNYSRIKEDDVKACIWILNYMAYGQAETISMSDEWLRLTESLILEKKQ